MKSFRILVLAVLCAASSWANASFHLWQIQEIYSDGGRTVQFIELSTTAGGQQFIAGHTITVTQGASTHSFTFPTDLPGDSANKSFLIGTQSFADLGVVTPDYIVPDGFVFGPSGVVDFAGVDTFPYSMNITGGSMFRNGSGSIFGSPTNFAGQTGSVPVPTPSAPLAVSAVPGNAQATVSFSAPVSSGASSITGYRVTCNPGAVVANGAASPIVVTGLANGVAYSCSVVAINSSGSGAASAPVSVTPVAPPSATASGPSPTGTGTITAFLSGGGVGCAFASSSFIAVQGASGSPPAGSAPPGVVFPQGLFDFSLAGCTPASAVTITVVYPTPLPSGAQYWKYGPTAAQPSPHWYVLPATIAGSTASFTIVDGGLGDDDLAANGSIVDQGGPGSAAAIPTLSEWALMLLAALLAASGWVAARRRAVA